MGWVLMSERDLNRLEVLAQIDDGRLSVGNCTAKRRTLQEGTFWHDIGHVN
jgi:hypothetical protein